MPYTVDYDQTAFDQVKKHHESVSKDYGTLNDDRKLYEKIYLMDTTIPKREVELTILPDAVNQVDGAVRLVVATDPIFDIVVPQESGIDEETIANMKRFAEFSWMQAGRLRNCPVHYDIILSAILFGEYHVGLISTADMLEAARKAETPDSPKSKGRIARAEIVAQRTPYLFEVYPVIDGYPEFDSTTGQTSAYGRVGKVRVIDLINKFGAVPPNIESKGLYEYIDVNMFYDYDTVWYWSGSEVIYFTEHGFPCVPIVCGITDGSTLFGKEEQRRRPLLYTLLKSGLWDRGNAIMSAIYYNLKQIGIVPLFKHVLPKSAAGSAPKKLDIDFSTMPATVSVEQGEDFVPLVLNNVLPPDMLAALELTQRKIAECTIQPAALGAPVIGADTYSEISLLSQSGRLPLINTQRRGSWGIGNIIETMFTMMKYSKQKFNSDWMKFAPADIKSDYMVEVKLDVKMPQDRLQNANIAALLTKKDDPITSKEFVRREVIGMSNPDEEEARIFEEQAFAVRQMAKLNQMARSAIQPTVPNANTPLQAGAKPNAGMNANPLPPNETEGGLPAVMAGNIPGQGNIMSPPEGAGPGGIPNGGGPI